jgi:Tfp pilus assembly protein PilP
LLINSSHIAFADNNDDGLILRPAIEYSSGDLRDPFIDLFQLSMEKEQKDKEEQDIPVLGEDTETQKPLPSLEEFKVQGVIWGGKFPQVIINDKILGVGDAINEAEIVNIEKNWITLNFSGRQANLATPGNAPALEKEDNTPG